MSNERDFENLLAEYPELIEPGLRLIGRQITLFGGRCDLLFEDTLQRQLLIELKWGPITHDHVTQILRYAGSIWSDDNPHLRIMLIGTMVPEIIRRGLDYLGIAWKQINRKDILQFLREKSDIKFVPIFVIARKISL